MNAAEAGAIAGLVTAVVGLLTWAVTTRNGSRTFTANEEQAFAARQQNEISYLSEQLRACRQESDRLREQITRWWDWATRHGIRPEDVADDGSIAAHPDDPEEPASA